MKMFLPFFDEMASERELMMAIGLMTRFPITVSVQGAVALFECRSDARMAEDTRRRGCV